MSDYENELRAKAKAYAEAECLLVYNERLVDEARARADKVRKCRDEAANELKKCVGRNVPRRIFSVDDKAVLVSMNDEQRVTVSLEDML